MACCCCCWGNALMPIDGYARKRLRRRLIEISEQPAVIFKERDIETRKPLKKGSTDIYDEQIIFMGCISYFHHDRTWKSTSSN